MVALNVCFVVGYDLVVIVALVVVLLDLVFVFAFNRGFLFVCCLILDFVCYLVDNCCSVSVGWWLGVGC